MRSPAEMFALFEEIASSDERIRVVTLEGSRVNPNAAADAWQDYDVTLLVTDVASFTQSGGRTFFWTPTPRPRGLLGGPRWSSSRAIS